jgi:hypothetical protein
MARATSSTHGDRPTEEPAEREENQAMHRSPRPLDRGPRRLVGLLLIPFLVIAAGCSTAGAPASPAATANGGASPAGPASGAVAGAPALAPGPVAGGLGAPNGAGVSNGGTSSSGSGVAAPNQAIAYPYPIYPGSTGVAPDHTIVVVGVGVGEAAVKADLSDRAPAQRSALAAALADAKAQADVVAGAAGVTITGILSVSVSSGQSYAVPMVAGAAGSAPGAAPGGPTTAVPPAVMPVEPGISQFSVSVTVAYRIG